MSESTSYEIIEISGLMYGGERALSWRDTIELKKEKTRKFCVKHILSTTFSKGHSETEAHVMCTLTILR